MGSKYFAVLLLILLACEPALQTIPTSEYQPAVEAQTTQTSDLCKNVNCTNGQTCQNGKCACPDDKKLCDNKCISKEKCCTDKDCETGLCLNSTCTTPKECSLGEEFKNGECTCAKDRIYCPEQKKCINKDKCCTHAQCDSFERCVPTSLKASLCIIIEDKKVCRALADQDRTELFTVKETEFKVKPTDWWNDNSITFTINNQSIRLKFNELTNFSNATIYQEGITISGGYCKEDEE